MNEPTLRKTACAGCPFRRGSVPGWLGAYRNAAHFLQVHYHQEEPNPCHVTVDYDRPDWREAWIAGENGKLCRGQQIMFENSFKLPRTWTLDPSVGRDIENFFRTVTEFLEHHNAEETQMRVKKDDDIVEEEADRLERIQKRFGSAWVRARAVDFIEEHGYLDRFAEFLEYVAEE